MQHSTAVPLSSKKLKLTPEERKSSASLAMLFAVRTLGLFLLTPVFASAAKQLTGGDNVALVGLAIGAYGLTQALMQIPFGILSDRFGRRPIIIVGMLLFIVGGIICALSDTVVGIIIGRSMQGLGAVSAAITAWIADATRPEVRTRAMSMVGGSIGISFAASLILAPLLVDSIGLNGLFWIVSLLGFVSLLVATFIVPVVPIEQQAIADVPIKDVLKNDHLLRLNIGVFCLHFMLMSLFVVLPPLLADLGGLSTGQLWQVYFPVIAIAVAFMVPFVFYIETRKRHTLGLQLGVWVLLLSSLVWSVASQSFWGIVLVTIVFFVAFNVLEALIPSMVSCAIVPQHKGLALGLYNMFQALGVASGGAVGGLLVQYGSIYYVFIGGAILSAFWLYMAHGLKVVMHR